MARPEALCLEKLCCGSILGYESNIAPRWLAALKAPCVGRRAWAARQVPPTRKSCSMYSPEAEPVPRLRPRGVARDICTHWTPRTVCPHTVCPNRRLRLGASALDACRKLRKMASIGCFWLLEA